MSCDVHERGSGALCVATASDWRNMLYIHRNQIRTGTAVHWLHDCVAEHIGINKSCSGHCHALCAVIHLTRLYSWQSLALLLWRHLHLPLSLLLSLALCLLLLLLLLLRCERRTALEHPIRVRVLSEPDSVIP
jgi:hypothetical protein